MLSFAWLVLGSALAGTPALDASHVCGAKERVVLSPELQRGFRARAPCKSLVSAQAVADFLKAFALRSRELADPENAERLVRTVDARWLLIRDGDGYQVYDAEAGAFVPPSVFAETNEPEPKTEDEKAAEAAYRAAYGALRAKRYEQARTALTECLKRDPEHAGCHWELGWVHWVAEDWAAAAASWTEVERIQPDYPELGQWLPKAQAKAPPKPAPVED